MIKEKADFVYKITCVRILGALNLRQKIHSRLIYCVPRNLKYLQQQMNHKHAGAGNNHGSDKADNERL